MISLRFADHFDQPGHLTERTELQACVAVEVRSATEALHAPPGQLLHHASWPGAPSSLGRHVCIAAGSAACIESGVEAADALQPGQNGEVLPSGVCTACCGFTGCSCLDNLLEWIVSRCHVSRNLCCASVCRPQPQSCLRFFPLLTRFRSLCRLRANAEVATTPSHGRVLRTRPAAGTEACTRWHWWGLPRGVAPDHVSAHRADEQAASRQKERQCLS